MQEMNLVLIISMLLAFVFAMPVETKKDVTTIYVDRARGSLKEDCGKMDGPCRDIDGRVLHIIRNSQLDVVLKIKFAFNGKDSPNPHKYAFKAFDFDDTRISITVKQWGKRKPWINLMDNNHMFLINGKNHSFQQRVTLSGLILNSPKDLFLLKRSNVLVNIISCDLKNVKGYLVHSEIDIKVELNIKGVNCTNCRGIASFQSLLDTSVITVNGSQFISVGKKAKYDGIIIKKSENLINVRVKQTLLENLKNPLEIHKNQQCVNVTGFEIEDCVVRGNANPIYVSGCFVSNIRRSRFENNNGGAFFAEKTDIVLFENNTFVNNKGNGAVEVMNTGLTKDGAIRPGGHVLVNNTIFINNTRSKDGGAIYASDSHLVIKFCKFENNTANTSGGAIYHSSANCEHCSVKMRNVSMISALDEFSSKGTLLFSDKLVTHVNVTGKIRYSGEKNDQTSINAMESGYSMDIKYNVNSSFYFECPMHFIPSSSLTKQDVDKKSKVTHMIYGVKNIHCNVCPEAKYIAKPAIMRSPTPKTKGLCIACPDGGNCSNGIQSQDDFWGHDAGGEIKFTACPYSYCCSKSKSQCKGITTCAANREGILCGSCKKDYTLSFYSNDCVKKGTCNRLFFWIANLIWLLASIFFFYNYQRVVGTIAALEKVFRGCRKTSSDPLSVQYNGSEGQANLWVDSSESTSNIQPSHGNPSSSVEFRDEPAGDRHASVDVDGLAMAPQAPSDLFSSDLLTIKPEENALIDMGESDNTPPLFQSVFGEQQGPSLQNFSDSEEVLFSAADKILGKTDDNNHDDDDEPSPVKTNRDFENIDIGGAPQESTAADALHIGTFFDASIGGENIRVQMESSDEGENLKSEVKKTSDENPSTTTTETEQRSDCISDDVSMINVIMDDELTMSESDVQRMNFAIGLLQMLFFYYQCLSLVKVYDLDQYGQGFINNIFRFQLSVYKTCPFEDNNKNTKDWFAFAYLVAHPILPALLCMTQSLFKFFKGKENTIKPQIARLAINLLVLTYIPMATLALSMITCTNINGESRYYFDATISCYTKPQILMILLTVYWIAPLPFAFYGACKMVQLHLIPMKQFYLILLCPWFSLYSYYIARKRRFQKLELTKTEVQEMSIILKGVFGSFRKSKEEDLEVAFNGQAVNLARGLLLALTIPFATHHHGTRLSLTLPIIIASLYHQYRYKPYTTQTLNRIAFGILGVLLSVNIANLMWAFKYKYAMDQSSFLTILETVLNIGQCLLTLVPGLLMIGVLGIGFLRTLQPYLKTLITHLHTGRAYDLQSRPAIQAGSGPESGSGAEFIVA